MRNRNLPTFTARDAADISVLASLIINALNPFSNFNPLYKRSSFADLIIFWYLSTPLSIDEKCFSTTTFILELNRKNPGLVQLEI